MDILCPSRTCQDDLDLFTRIMARVDFKARKSGHLKWSGHVWNMFNVLKGSCLKYVQLRMVIFKFYISSILDSLSQKRSEPPRQVKTSNRTSTVSANMPNPNLCWCIAFTILSFFWWAPSPPLRVK